MKIKVLPIIASIVFAGFIAGTVLLVREAEEKDAPLTCKDITVIYSDKLRFLTEPEVRGIINEGYGAVTGMRIPEISLAEIERTLGRHPEVKGCEAWIGKDCILRIELSQRMPLAKYLPSDGTEGFYCERGGATFPLCDHFEVKVPAISGDVHEDRKWLRDMEEFVDASRDSGLDSIWVKGKDIMVRTAQGRETFIVGSPKGCGRRLEKIPVYYDRVRAKKNYTSVNLKYDNQIICRNDTSARSISERPR